MYPVWQEITPESPSRKNTFASLPRLKYLGVPGMSEGFRKKTCTGPVWRAAGWSFSELTKCRNCGVLDFVLFVFPLPCHAVAFRHQSTELPFSIYTLAECLEGKGYGSAVQGLELNHYALLVFFPRYQMEQGKYSSLCPSSCQGCVSNTADVVV